MYTRKMDLEAQISGYIPVQNGAVQFPDAYGIEVELEGKNFISPPENVNLYWTMVKDGSLRCKYPDDCAIEYVSRQPFPIGHTEKAITALFDYLTGPNVKVYDSYRTSIHVHVNFAAETFRTVYNMMTLSLILDELLVSQNGEHRIGNNFCLRAKDALGQVQSLINSINNGHNIFDVPGNDRYSSINFASMLKYGSIEFRSLECTTHEGRLLHWIGTLAAMKKSAKLYVNPVEIISQFSASGPKPFLCSILGTHAAKYLHVDGMEEMLFNGMRIAQDLAYCSEWNEITQADKDAAKALRQKQEADLYAKLKKAQPKGY